MSTEISSLAIAVLGGSGFIGTRLVGRLLELGYQVRIGDLNPSTTYPDLQSHCDVRDASSIQGVLRNINVIINLAAEHRDDVRPISRYHETNVKGAQEVCKAARANGIQTIIFTSSVAVYGFQTFPVDESGPFEPYNPYGETKLLAERIYRDWAAEDPSRKLVIIRPSVVFGEGNRGNVYNLFQQIATGHFLMIGDGRNRKSMAYVGNVADFLAYALTLPPGSHTFNYIDGPDLDMNSLISQVNKCLGRSTRVGFRVPTSLALVGGYCFDFIALITGQRFPISAIRVKKFCESTQCKAELLALYGFTPRFSLLEGISNMIEAEFPH